LKFWLFYEILLSYVSQYVNIFSEIMFPKYLGVVG